MENLEVLKQTDVKALLESLPECENIVTTGQKAQKISFIFIS